MKKLQVFLFTFFIFSGLVAAKDANEFYVVVENNIHQQDYSIVKIYDEQDRLIYKEHFDGFYIDIKREKHRKLILKVDKQFKLFMKKGIAKEDYEGFIAGIFRINT